MTRSSTILPEVSQLYLLSPYAYIPQEDAASLIYIPRCVFPLATHNHHCCSSAGANLKAKKILSTLSYRHSPPLSLPVLGCCCCVEWIVLLETSNVIVDNRGERYRIVIETPPPPQRLSNILVSLSLFPHRPRHKPKKKSGVFFSNSIKENTRCKPSGGGGGGSLPLPDAVSRCSMVLWCCWRLDTSVPSRNKTYLTFGRQQNHDTELALVKSRSCKQTKIRRLCHIEVERCDRWGNAKVNVANEEVQ